LTPGYEQKRFSQEDRRGLRLIASSDGRDGSLTIHQDADVYASILQADRTVSHRIGVDRAGWIQVARGRLQMNGAALSAGDGARIHEESELSILASEPSEFLLFDLA
jgi:hypothetical protein